eukprot:4026370-Pyramimonas_sp.AAC.1
MPGVVVTQRAIECAAATTGAEPTPGATSVQPGAQDGRAHPRRRFLRESLRDQPTALGPPAWQGSWIMPIPDL